MSLLENPFVYLYDGCMIEFNSKQRKLLEKAAHDLSPVVIVGGSGLTEGIEKMTDSQLASHELIKISFNEFKDEKVEITNELAEKCDATIVRIIGNKAILYRPAQESEKRQFEKGLNKLSK